ncbi:Hsp70 family protein [Dactylosporangium sp. CA-139066]|uniref:Hsp70 family protein n=1 Tax=Dactylosporangium sp. CA-139066 TaxID=3239930 RepID=UPI003D8AC302
MRLGVDLGTSHTVAVLARAGGRGEPLLFDSSPLLPSAVWAGGDGALLVGRDAQRSARLDPSAYEPNPKRRIDEAALLLGGRELPVVDALAAVLARVVEEAIRVGGASPAETVLTYPAGWGPQRRGLLLEAARRAALPDARLLPEPVAAAMYFTGVLGHRVPPGSAVVVYDFGGGTFDVSVVRRTGDGWDVLTAEGLDDVGGVDLDAAIVDWIGTALAPRDPALWPRLVAPQTLPDRRHGRVLWDDARSTKELLSRAATAGIAVPLYDVDLHLTRAEFEALARPWLDRTIALTTSTLAASGVTADRLAGVFLVGGASRVPLVATLLHRALSVAPVILEQPELVVAQGSLLADASLHTAPSPVPAPVSAMPISPPPVSPSPVSAMPVSPSPVSTMPVSPAVPVSVGPVAPALAGPVASAPAGPVAPAPAEPARRVPRFAVACLFLSVLIAVVLGIAQYIDVSGDHSSACSSSGSGPVTCFTVDSSETSGVVAEVAWIATMAAVTVALLGLRPAAGPGAARGLHIAAVAGCAVATLTSLSILGSPDNTAGILTVLVIALVWLPAAAIALARRRQWPALMATALGLFPIGWLADGAASGYLLGIPETLLLALAAVGALRAGRRG